MGDAAEGFGGRRLGVRLVEHPTREGLRAVVLDVRTNDEDVRRFAQVGYGRWVEFPDGAEVPIGAFNASM
jgi:hypothetical protein